MKREQLLELLAPYNPWWKTTSDWRSNLPDYRRPIVDELLARGARVIVYDSFVTGREEFLPPPPHPRRVKLPSA